MRGAIVLLFMLIAGVACKPIDGPKSAGCSTSSDCAAWETCSSGTCVRLGESTTKGDRCANITCPAGGWCDRTTGDCHSGPQACAQNEDCTGSKSHCDALFGVCRECAT